MINRFILNEVSYFGAGSRKELPEVLARLNLHKALVTTDKGLLKVGTAQMVTEVLDKAGFPYEIYSEIKPNPTVTNVKQGVEAFKASGADCIIAIGGGSSMDTAKGIGIVTANPEFADVVSLEGCAPTKHKSIPIIALPTTAGTGAEVTINYVIIDEEHQKKMVCVDPNDIPAVAIIDPELMYSLPKGLTAATGMDALTHAIEGYITKGAWVMSDMYELQAIKMIAENLPLAVEEPTNPVGREGMALAQYIAAQAFSNVGLGLVHGMAHPMGSLFDIPHGVANALLLPTIMEYNMPCCIEKYGVIARTMGVDTTGMTPEQAAQAACDAVKALAIRVGIPQHLSELGIKEENRERIFERFYQVDNPDMNISDGGGGLSIVRDFVTLHDGTVNVMDNTPVGCVFVIHIPVKRSESKPTKIEQVQVTDKPVEDISTLQIPEFYMASNAGEESEEEPNHIITIEGLEEDIRRLESGNTEEIAEEKNIETISAVAPQRATVIQLIEGEDNEMITHIIPPEGVQEMVTAVPEEKSELELKTVWNHAYIDFKPSGTAITSMDEKLINHAVKYVEDNIVRSDLSVEELSKELGMSRVHLYKKLLAITGKTPIEFIRIIRLKRAAQLLRGSQQNISEIAYQVGFNNPKYFSRYFKEEFGILPSAFQYRQGR